MVEQRCTLPARTGSQPDAPIEDERTNMRSRSRVPGGVGATLRETRIRAGVQLSDVQAQTGIDAKYLRALEWERFDLLPSFDYARRVAQAEARVLQLDPDTTVAELDRTIATLPTHGPLMGGELSDAPAIVTPPVVEAAQTSDPPPPVEPSHATRPQVEPSGVGAPRVDPSVRTPPPRTPEYRLPRTEEPPPVSTQRVWSDDRRLAPLEIARTSPRARVVLVVVLLGGLAAFLIIALLVLRDDDSASQPAALALADESASAATTTQGAGTDASGGATRCIGTRSSQRGAERSAEGAGASAAAATSTRAEPAGRKPGNESQAAPLSKVQQVEIATPRGESWLQVRRGSSDGRILYEGLLGTGGSLKFEAKTLFIRVGAASAVDVPPGRYDRFGPARGDA